MKIVCDACSAKYSIADEKVRGKVFKIRCKKCSNIIMVRGTAGNDPPQEQYEQQKETRVYDYDGGGSDEAVWHLVINQEQVGPLSEAEVRQRFARGEIDLETYTWREGFADWSPLSAVEPFTNLASGGGAGGGDAVAAMFGTAAPEEGATVQSDPADIFAAAGAAGDDGGADLFGSQPPQGVSGGLFSGNGAAAQAASPRNIDMSAEAERRLRGERNENSVLFSLNNLAALASDSPKAVGGSAQHSSGPAISAGSSGAGMAAGEGSGLIDIRSMAQVYLDKKSPGAGPSLGSDGDLPVFAQPAFAAPMILPTSGQVSNNNKPLYIMLGVIGALVVAATVVLVIVLKGGDKQPAVAANTTEPQNPPTQPTGEATTPTPTPDKPPAADTSAAKPDDKGGDEPKDEPKDDDTSAPATSSRKTTDSGSKPTKSSSTPTSSSSKSDPKKSSESSSSSSDDSGGSSSKCLDEVGCLLADKPPACCSKYGGKKSSSSSSSSSSSKPKDDNLPDSLSPSDVRSTMDKIRGKVSACGSKFPAKGLVNLGVKVAPSGSVSSATVKSSPDPGLGNCAASATKSAKFPATKKGASFNYPWKF